MFRWGFGSQDGSPRSDTPGGTLDDSLISDTPGALDELLRYVTPESGTAVPEAAESGQNFNMLVHNIGLIYFAELIEAITNKSNTTDLITFRQFIDV